MLVDVSLSGWVDGLSVNGVDVTAFVSGELDRRHPERLQLRALNSPGGFRALWATVQQLWADLLAELPEAAEFEQVDDEWSIAETLRHLVFITDSWASRTVLDLERPFHRLALPQTAYSPAEAAALGMDLDAEPTFDEVAAARADRIEVITALMDGLTGTELGRMCTRPPAPGYPEGDRSVGECLAVVLEEECDHYRYALRDLRVLMARS